MKTQRAHHYRYWPMLLLCAVVGLFVTRAVTSHDQDVGQTNPAAGGPSVASCEARTTEDPIPYHVQPYALHSGMHQGRGIVKPNIAYQQVVRADDAPWLQLHFGPSNLGTSSKLIITSLKDKSTQRFDARSLTEWNYQSASFNGEAVMLELQVAPEDRDVFFQLQELRVGDWPASPSAPAPFATNVPVSPNMVCGADDRVASNDNAVARTFPGGCTAWIASNGAGLTAGHCVAVGVQRIDFNVPRSLADGRVQFPPAADQYPVVVGSIVFVSNGVGDDWAIFRVGPNANTRLSPPMAYGMFYRIQPQTEPAQVRVTGYGVDGPAPCFGESRQPGCLIPAPTPVPRNSDNQTQQTAVGAGHGINNTTFSHDVDITGGDSGGPVRFTDTRIAVAINTHGTADATCTIYHNSGTAFSNAGLSTTLNNFPDLNVRYVDAGYPAWTTADGTYFRPFSLVSTAINNVPTSGVVSIVTGHYNEALTINRAMILQAPVGAVVIGAP